jgi:hypothetical protein
MTPFHKRFYEMAAEEAAAAGDQYLHRLSTNLTRAVALAQAHRLMRRKPAEERLGRRTILPDLKLLVTGSALDSARALILHGEFGCANG